MVSDANVALDDARERLHGSEFTVEILLQMTYIQVDLVNHEVAVVIKLINVLDDMYLGQAEFK